MRISLLVVVCLVVSGCNSGPGAESTGPLDSNIQIQVHYDSALEVLRIQGRFPARVAQRLTADRTSRPFIKDVLRRNGGQFDTPERSDNEYRFAGDQNQDADISWTFDLREFHRSSADSQSMTDGILLVRLWSFLLLPADQAPGFLRLEFVGPAEILAVPYTGQAADGAYVISRESIEFLPPLVFGPFDRRRIESDGGHVDLLLAGEFQTLKPDEIEAWTRRGLAALTEYFGRLPVARVVIAVYPGQDGVYASTEGAGGAWINLPLARETTLADLQQDWVMTHELVHLTFPQVAVEDHWLEEGIATYVEPLARLRTGELAPAEVWNAFKDEFRRGLSNSGRGLRGTRDRDQLYWGGALFFFEYDRRLLVRSRGQFGLQEALTNLVSTGWNIHHFATAIQVLERLDAAAGDGTIGVDLYREFSDTAFALDLEAAWRELGVVSTGKSIRFDDSAPGSFIRRRISGEPHSTTKDKTSQ